jgi:hypothetical protein
LPTPTRAASRRPSRDGSVSGRRGEGDPGPTRGATSGGVDPAATRNASAAAAATNPLRHRR